MPLEPETSLSIPFWLEAIAIVAGALAGSLRGIREQLAISGVVALAIALGLGGGLVRDTLLQSGTPVAINDSRFLPIVLGVTAVTLLLLPLLTRVEWAVFATDSLAIGIYSVLGADKALLLGVPPVGALLVGVLAGTGGSILADLIVGVPPVLFRPGLLLGVASTAGTIVFIAGSELLNLRTPSFVAAVVLITTARIVSAATGWGVGPVVGFTARRTPKQGSAGPLHQRTLRRRRRGQSDLS
jgi:uncharacterized membrane protein YeiH